MFDKIKWLVFIWACVIFAYIILAFTSDMWTDMSETASAEMDTQNMTGIYGVQEAIDSSNYWKWVIPGAVGLVTSTIMLREEIREAIENRRS